MYLRGSGIEIGALARPMRVPRGVTVRYVDRLSREDLLKHYPSLKGKRLAPVDIVDDGERLATLADGSQDFVIAQHVLEHMENPLRGLQNMLRVLRVGGVVYLSVPDMRFTFDAARPPTSFLHVWEDFELGGEFSRQAHYEEWERLVPRTGVAEADRGAEQLMADRWSIHFHAWAADDLLEMLLAAKRELGFPFELELFCFREREVMVVLRKTGAPDGRTEGTTDAH